MGKKNTSSGNAPLPQRTSARQAKGSTSADETSLAPESVTKNVKIPQKEVLIVDTSKKDKLPSTNGEQSDGQVVVVPERDNLSAAMPNNCEQYDSFEQSFEHASDAMHGLP